MNTLLTSDDPGTSSMEDLRTILPRSLQQALPVMTRTNSYNFCPPSHSDPLHYEKSFPWLFPYSRGGPDDHIAKSRTKMQTFGEYTKQGLLQGFHADGRRMFIFTAYYNEQRRIIGSVAHQATKSKSAGASTRSSTAPGQGPLKNHCSKMGTIQLSRMVRNV